MYSIEVYAAFDFLKDETCIGTLDYERLKGSSSYRFSFDREFLARFPRFRLSADLGNFPGIQSVAGRIFACLGDTLPDRWGRALIDKRERLLAAKTDRMPRQFDDFGYLVRIDDATRMGALRFKYDGTYLGMQNGGQSVPPATGLADFIREAHEIELAEKKGADLIREEWLHNVWKQGSSLGGARPKANVADGSDLWIAKIPSVKDGYDAGLWEHFAATLAANAGIAAAESRLIRTGPTPFHTLLTKRFDRDGEKRIHFASSLTLTGLHDGSGAEDNKGYIDIADAIVSDIGVRHPDDNLAELYRRIAFNILIGNHDDHFRNHGFLLRADGWELSPAYDMNPTNILTQSLLISTRSNRSSLKELLDASDYYLIKRSSAEQIIRETYLSVENWRKQAKVIGIAGAEQERFARRIEYSLDEARKLFPRKTTIVLPSNDSRCVKE